MNKEQKKVVLFSSVILLIMLAIAVYFLFINPPMLGYMQIGDEKFPTEAYEFIKENHNGSQPVKVCNIETDQCFTLHKIEKGGENE